MNNILSEHYIDSLAAIAPTRDQLIEQNRKLREKLTKVAAYMDRLAEKSERDEREYAGRFESLADACRKDAKNWRATAKDIRSVLG